MLKEQDDFASINPPAASSTTLPTTTTTTNNNARDAAVHRTVHFQGQALALETRWGVGIGGDIWTTGSLLCQFLERRHAFFQRVFRGARILCVACCSLQHSPIHPWLPACLTPTPI